MFKSLNKKGGSGNVPREIYAFGILITYILFVIGYLGILTIMTNTGHTSKCSSEDLQFTDYNNKIVGEQTNSLFSNVFIKMSCVPDEVNIIFAVLSALMITLFILAILHG